MIGHAAHDRGDCVMRVLIGLGGLVAGASLALAADLPVVSPVPTTTWVPPTAHAACNGGCGSRGGTGYRGPNGKCVEWEQLGRICGDPPTTRCTPECTVPDADLAAKLGAQIHNLMLKAHGQ
jgi:hypothetical protein